MLRCPGAFEAFWSSVSCASPATDQIDFPQRRSASGKAVVALRRSNTHERRELDTEAHNR